MYHVSLVIQCIYGWSDEVGEDGDGSRKGVFISFPARSWGAGVVGVLERVVLRLEVLGED